MTRWFYQMVSYGCHMVSSFQPLDLVARTNFTLDDATCTRITLLGVVSCRFAINDLVEEFLAVGVWPLRAVWRLLV